MCPEPRESYVGGTGELRQVECVVNREQCYLEVPKTPKFPQFWDNSRIFGSFFGWAVLNQTSIGIGIVIGLKVPRHITQNFQ